MWTMATCLIMFNPTCLIVYNCDQNRTYGNTKCAFQIRACDCPYEVHAGAVGGEERIRLWDRYGEAAGPSG